MTLFNHNEFNSSNISEKYSRSYYEKGLSDKSFILCIHAFVGVEFPRGKVMSIYLSVYEDGNR
jgi:hypothetical protein